jgi:beta-lactamase regulating signal transducer with metallopeptidase domain
MNVEVLIAATAGWLLTVALHGSVFLAAAWLIDRAWRAPPNAWRELMWRIALFGGVITASLQPIGGPSPIAARWQLAGTATASTAIAPAQTAAWVSDAQSMSVGAPVAARHSVVSTPADAAADIASATPGAALLFAPLRALKWPAWIVGIWLLGALFALTRVLRSLMFLRRALLEAAPVSLGAAAELAELVELAAVRSPRLLRLAGIASPMATTGARIVAPAWALESLDRRQLRAMLAHELAHVVRHDPEWKVASAFWRALFWFLPTTFAQRRLDDLAELACDAFAVQQTGNAHGVAECLAACAEHQIAGAAYALAAAMAVHESSFGHRIECLLEGVSMQPVVSGVRSRALALIVLAAAGLCLPTISLLSPQIASAAPAPAPPPAPPKPAAAAKADASAHSSVSIHSDDDGHDKMTISVSDDDHKFKANIDGKIAFNAEETDVASLGAGGTASFEETRGGATHRIEFADRKGQLERRYFVDQKEQPFDAAGSKWFAGLLPALIRESGLGADARVQRLYSAGGAGRVLDEIERIHSDYVRGIYLGLLLDRSTLTPPQLDQALKIAGAASSDYERHQMLSRIFAKQPLSAAQQMTFLQQALRFNSDYELAELLIGVVPKLANSPEVRQAWLNAALKVSSDYERRRTLESMLTHDNFDDSQLGSVLEASASMGSDYEHRELLVAVARRAPDVDALAPAYAHSTLSLGSDYERREALLALIQAGKLGPRGTKAVLDSAAHIGSDYECREVLVALARVMPDDAASTQHYRDVASRLSAYERGEAERALKR